MKNFSIFSLILAITILLAGLVFTALYFFLRKDLLTPGLSLIFIGIFLIYIREHLKNNYLL